MDSENSRMIYTAQNVEENINGGKDYVIGDIHGMYSYLMELLKSINFDFKKDRLFSVGDLIDRGHDNLECLNLITESWFFPCLGNHELMMVEACEKFEEGAGLQIKNNSVWNVWISNGGGWYNRELNSASKISQFNMLLKEAEKLPLFLSFISGGERYNLVHGEAFHSGVDITDEFIDRWNDDCYLEDSKDWLADRVIWGRQLLKASNYGNGFFIPPQYLRDGQLSKTFSGHTIINKPIRIGNQFFIDGGSFLGAAEDGKFFVADIEAQEIIVFSMKQQRIIERVPM